jgi:hypothetical protein
MQNSANLKNFVQLCALVVAGSCIGFLSGLSATSISQTLISALLGLAGGVLGVIAGIKPSADSEEASKVSLPSSASPEESPKVPVRLAIKHVTVVPFAFFTAALLLGTVNGIVCRTNDWLGANPKWAFQRWQAGLSEKEVAVRLFNEIHPVSPAVAPLTNRGVLTAGVSASDCALIKGEHSPKLRNLMAARPGLLAELEKLVPNDQQLESIVDKAVCPEY